MTLQINYFYICKIFMYIGWYSLPTYIFLMIYLMFAIGRRFEKLFHNVKDVGMSYRYGQKIGRFDGYIGMITNYDFEKESNTKEYQKFDGYDFRKYLKKGELILVKLYIYSMFLGAGSILLWAILKYWLDGYL